MPIDYLLTLAIPTYNRAEILDETLKCLIENPDFNDKVEVVISDNHSTDNTQQVVQKYVNSYSNIKYYLNSENIRDANFSKVLYYGNGLYLKLFNDTLRFREGMLKFMLAEIDKNKETKPNLYFYQNNHRYKNTCKQGKGVDSFLNTASFSCTWIANFGLWRAQLADIEDINRSNHLLLPQVDWSLQLSNNNKNTIFYYRKYYKVFIVNNKGTYNIFDVFVNNYFSLISPYLNNKQITKITYQKEKFRLFKHFIFKWLVTLLLKQKGKYSFSIDNYRSIIVGHYKYCFYSYIYFVLFCVKSIFYLPRIIKK